MNLAELRTEWLTGKAANPDAPRSMGVNVTREHSRSIVLHIAPAGGHTRITAISR